MISPKTGVYLPQQHSTVIPQVPIPTPSPKDSLIAKGWQREQYIGISILLIGLIAIIGFFSRRFEYALLFAFALSIVLIIFFLMV